MSPEYDPQVGDSILTAQYGELKIFRRFNTGDGDWIYHTIEANPPTGHTAREYRFTLAELDKLELKKDDAKS